MVYDILDRIVLLHEPVPLLTRVPIGFLERELAFSQLLVQDRIQAVTRLFLFGLERGVVVGTVKPSERKSDEELEAELVDDELLEEEENESDNPDDYKGLDLKGWIQLLPQNFLIHDGLRCLEDFPDVVTNVRGMVADLDATSAYPTATLVGNVSKKTCVNEVIRIDGLSEETFREQNLSVCLGGVNTLEYFNVMFSMPSMDSQEMDMLIDSVC